MRLNKRIIPFAASAFLLLTLVSCGNASGSIVNANPDSIYGSVSDFSVTDLKNVAVGTEVKFKVTPAEDFLVSTVKVNGSDATSLGDSLYSWKVVEGTNKVVADFTIDKTVDFVDKFKLQLPDDVYNNVLNHHIRCDFRGEYNDLVKGVEQALPESRGGFVNYVDGDTTHIETFHYGYTVKLRYLSIDTPESTSEIEEWGKSASNFNKSILKNAKRVILESQGWARGDEDKKATVDGNQRSLAYVWYSNLETPTMNDFRCLNLEMVYQGFSQGIGSVEQAGDYFYRFFDKANKSAVANKRGQFSGEVDANYCYDAPVDITMKEIYDGTTRGQTDSPLKDQKTFYRIKGYVSRKIKGAFYFQDKPSYDQVGTEHVDAYGLYVFSYAQTPLKVGDEVSVIGVLSDYGGAYQLQGISYHDFDIDPNRDMEILSSGHEIVPVKVTKEDFTKADQSGVYDHVLVEFVDDVYCYDKTSSYGGVTTSASEGGVENINKYNTKYPFYNDNNKIITFAKLGSAGSSFDLRIVKDQDILVSYGKEISRSFRFFTGGINYYYPEQPSYVAYQASTKDFAAFKDAFDAHKGDAEMITTTYKAKHMKLTAISQNYLSSSGKTQQYQAVIADPGDANVLGEI